MRSNQTSLVRQIVRECIMNEAAVKSVPEGLAVTVFKEEDFVLIGLWDTDDFVYDVKQMIETCKAKGEKVYPGVSSEAVSVFGTIQLTDLESQAWNPSGHGWYVQASAAQKGFGPLMYQIALSTVGPFTSDRETVSKEAARVWNGFKSGMTPGVKLKKLDDEVHPLTKTKRDDAMMAWKTDKEKTDPDDEWRDWALTGKRINTSRAVKLGEETFKDVAREIVKAFPEMTYLDVISGLRSQVKRSTINFFQNKYSSDPF